MHKCRIDEKAVVYTLNNTALLYFRARKVPGQLQMHLCTQYLIRTRINKSYKIVISNHWTNMLGPEHSYMQQPHVTNLKLMLCTYVHVYFKITNIKIVNVVWSRSSQSYLSCTWIKLIEISSRHKLQEGNGNK